MCSRCLSGVHHGPRVRAAVVAGVAVRGIQAAFGGHQRPGDRAAVPPVLHRGLRAGGRRLRHEVVDGERVVEGVVGGVVVGPQVRGLVQQQRGVVRGVREQVLGVRERRGHAHGAGGQQFAPARLGVDPRALDVRGRGGRGGGVRGVGAGAAGGDRAALRALLLTGTGRPAGLEALLPPQVAAVLEHVPGVRVQRPEGALPRFVR